MEYWIFGAVIGALGLLWAALSLQDDPLEEGIRQAHAWDAQQKAITKAIGK